MECARYSLRTTVEVHPEGADVDRPSMKYRAWTLAPVILVCSLTSPATAQQGSANCQDNVDHTTTTCTIHQPVVDGRAQKGFRYENVVFRPGDLVTVTAGGCVQTGGHWKTWKRYVNPEGRDSDHLYFGTISVPPVPSTSAVHIQARLQYRIPTSVLPPNNVLVLGYKDDGYSDNGYYGHDDGDNDQCKQGPGKDGGPAWVVVTIQHGKAATGAPFDLVANAVDPNGLMLNPRWQFEIDKSLGPVPQNSPYADENHPNPSTLCNGFPYLTGGPKNVDFGNPPCTTQVGSGNIDVPSPGGLNDFGCLKYADPGKLHGHVNWWPATVTGHVIWAGHDPAGLDPLSLQHGDDDYNFKLYASNISLIVSDPWHNYIESEFDSDEVIDHVGSNWWTQFHDAVDRGGNTPDLNANIDAPASPMVNGKEAFVTGLVGLDSEHGAYSELHPIYAMGIHLTTDANDDYWAFFARNWGDEGFCSSEQHYWDTSTVSIFIPEPVPSSDFQLLDQDIHSNVSVTAEAGKVSGGVVIRFNIGVPDKTPLVDGTVHIRWLPGPGAPNAIARQLFAETPLAKERPAEGKAHEGPDGLVLPATLSADKLQSINQQLKKPAGVKNGVKVQVTRVNFPSEIAPRNVTSVVRPKTRAVSDTGKLQKEQHTRDVICAAYDNNIPGMPGACTKKVTHPLHFPAGPAHAPATNH